jgi:hypothetical protein
MKVRRIATALALFGGMVSIVSLPVTGRPMLPDQKVDGKHIQIQPGTALAKLVTEVGNNPANKVAVAVVTDGGHKIRTDLPQWLRAHYIRNHPAALTASRAKDPTGGFPMALESLYSWMLLHQDLMPGPEPKMADAVVVVPTGGTNVRISGTHMNPRSESDIRINPNNPMQIIASSNNIGNSRQAQFFSQDGGVSWGQTVLPLLAGDSLQSDPTVDWTSDGSAWATTIGISAGGASLQMRAYKSTDAGKTWVFDGTFSGGQTSADKQLMWVDRSSTSPFKDTIHVIWHNGLPAFVNRRTATGWKNPIQVSKGETTGTGIGSDITTNANGDVFAVWPDTGSRNVFVVKSTDGGVTYSDPLKIGNTTAAFQIRVPAFADRAALVGVSIAAFRNATRNDVYVAYTDLAGGAGGSTPDEEPGEDVSSPFKSRVWFIRSADGGATWEPAKQLNAAALDDQFNQRLAVDPETGTLGIVYYNSGVGQLRKKTNLVFQASIDNGTTWTKPVTVTNAMTDETTGDANQYGDYNGLSVVNETFFPCWTDRRVNQTESIFTAKITLTKTGADVTPVVFNGEKK